MSLAMMPATYLEKAGRALHGAKLLLAAGDIEGACNRAYYAMYDAAHAALLAENRADYKSTKTHSGLISAFGLHIVATNKISRELGRAFNEVEQIRLMADYTGEEIKDAQAKHAVMQAEAFLEAIKKLVLA